MEALWNCAVRGCSAAFWKGTKELCLWGCKTSTRAVWRGTASSCPDAAEWVTPGLTQYCPGTSPMGNSLCPVQNTRKYLTAGSKQRSESFPFLSKAALCCQPLLCCLQWEMLLTSALLLSWLCPDVNEIRNWLAATEHGICKDWIMLVIVCFLFFPNKSNNSAADKILTFRRM